MDLNNVLSNLVTRTQEVVPGIIGAIVLLVIGYIVGKVVGIIIREICIRVKLDKYVPNKGFKLSNLFKVAGEWTIYLVFIQSAAGVLGIEAITQFVGRIVAFIPNAAGAAVVMVVGYILGNFFYEHIRETEGAYSELIGKVVYFFTVYVSLTLALPLIGIKETLLNNILLIIIASVGLGFALAVGLGLKDVVAKEAQKYIAKMEKRPTKRRR